MKTSIKDRAAALREQGMSFGEIASTLNISKSTAYRHAQSDDAEEVERSTSSVNSEATPFTTEFDLKVREWLRYIMKWSDDSLGIKAIYREWIQFLLEEIRKETEKAGPDMMQTYRFTKDVNLFTQKLTIAFTESEGKKVVIRIDQESRKRIRNILQEIARTVPRTFELYKKASK